MSGESTTWGPEFAQALLEAQRAAKRVPADGTHYDNYPYSSIHIITEELRKVLLEHELTVDLVDSKIVDETELETKGGGSMWMTDVRATFQVTHAATGQYRLYRIVGRRSNDKDKSVMQATSSAFTTFLPRLLNVTTAEVDQNNPLPEATGSRGRRSGGGKRQRRQQQAPPPRQDAGPSYKKEGDSWVNSKTGEVYPMCSKCRGAHVDGHCLRPDCDGDPVYPDAPAPSSAGSSTSNEGEKAATAKADRDRKVLLEHKAEYRRAIGKVESWQEEAVWLATSEVPTDFAEWTTEHYRYILALFKRHGAPVVVSRAVEHMAKQEPADPDQVEILRERAKDCRPIIFQRAEMAAQTGWSRAVAEALNLVADEELRDD